MSRLFSLSLLLLLAACGGGGDPGVASAPENEPPIVLPAESFTLSFEPVLYPRDTVLLADGSTLIAGGMMSDLTVASRTEPSIMLPSANGPSYIACHDAAGNYAWSKQYGGTLRMGPAAAAPDGTVFVCFAFIERTTLEGREYEIGARRIGILLAHYDRDGTALDVRMLADGGSQVEQIKFGDDGSLFVLFRHTDPTTLDPDSGSPLELPAYTSHMTLVRYAPDGTRAWARTHRGSNGLYGHALLPLADGDCVVAMEYGYRASFFYESPDEFDGVEIDARARRAVVYRLHGADGSLVWFNDLGGPAHPERLLETDDALYVAIDQQIGTITLDGVDYRSSVADSYLVSLHKDGSYRWVRAIEHNYSDLIGGLAERWDGWILLAGTVGGSVQFRGTTADQDMLLDEHSGFVALYHPNGDLLNVLSIEVGDGIRLEHLLVRDGSAWFSGVHTGSVRFSEGPELPAPTADYAAFLVKVQLIE